MDLTQQILDLASKGPPQLEETDRLALLNAVKKLHAVLENPIERFTREFFGIYDAVVTRTAVDLNLCDIALAHGGPISVAELAAKSTADPELIQRILHMLVPLGYFTETDNDAYALTPFGPILATGSPLREAVISISHIFPSIAALPEYLASTSYANPSDALDAPFNSAFNCKGESYFELIARPGMERYAKAFNTTMKLKTVGEQETFVKSYPAAERLRNDDPERVLFVDVGGSMGHQVRKFADAYPSLQGKLVLEDLPSVVDAATDVPESIIKVAHDFFKPQPETVRNAKAFYMRMILHDWPMKQAKAILSNIVDVMADDSVVLINDLVLPERGVGHLESKMDWHMMQLGAQERTEKQWKELAESAGLEVKQIWWEEESTARRGLIECTKKL